MIKMLLTMVVAPALLCSHNTSADATKDRSVDTAELTRLATESGHAYARRDLAALEQLTAEDYAQTDVRGGVLNRTQWLEFVRSRKTELTVESGGIEVRFYREVAIVTGRWTYTLKGTGQTKYLTRAGRLCGHERRTGGSGTFFRTLISTLMQMDRLRLRDTEATRARDKQIAPSLTKRCS
jgi:hypothetical protein